MRRPVVVLCALAVVLGVVAGCGRGEEPTAGPSRTLEPQNTASSPSPEAADNDSAACSLLTSKERSSIAGGKIDTVVPSSQQRNHCRWVKSGASPLPAIEVRASPSREWVTQLPALIEKMMVTGRAEDKFTKRLLAAKKKVLEGTDEISNREACEMFTLYLEANGSKKGSTEVIVFIPTHTAGGALATVQKCTRGTHTLLTYSETGLVASFPLQQALSRLLERAHRRAQDVY